MHTRMNYTLRCEEQSEMEAFFSRFKVENRGFAAQLSGARWADGRCSREDRPLQSRPETFNDRLHGTSELC